MNYKNLAGGVLALIVVLGWGSSALSAEIGRAQLNGREIILNDDRTWAFADEAAAPAAANCTTITSNVLPVNICLDPSGWQLGNLEGNQEHSFRRKDGELYLMMITETDYFPAKTLREAILVNAQNAAGLNKVNVVSESTENLGGHPFNRIVYRTMVDDLDVTYDNYYAGLEGKGSVQFVFFSLANEYDQFKPIVEKTATGIAVTE